MQVKNIEKNFTISEQITIEDIKTLAEMDVKVLICNRPEAEEPNQITNEQIIKETSSFGIKFVHIPSPGREIPPNSLDLFIKTLGEKKRKTHAYCRTGIRSSIFWELMQKSIMDHPNCTK